MALTSSKVGKSLLKFFRPILVAPPHGPGQESGRKSQPQFQLFQIKKAVVADPKRVVAQPKPAAAPKPPEKAPTLWLDFVLNLIELCHRASEKMRQRMGASAYQHALAVTAQQRIKTVGSIIDTRPAATYSQADRRRKAA